MKQFITAFVLLFVGIWFLALWYGGELDFYILPRFNILVIMSGVALLFFGVLLLIFGKSWHEVKYHLEGRSFLSFFVLLGAILFFPAQPLSSQSVAQRGVETNLSNIKLTAPINFQIDSTKRTFADWVNIIGTSANGRQYVGEKIKAQGFVYRDETLSDDEFYLARFLIRCCSADARPVVLRVKSEKSVQFKNDQWVEIRGVFAVDKNVDQPLFINLTSHEEIPIPETPYIY